MLREQLLLLQLRLEEGEIDEDDYAEQEAVLLARMRELRARQRAEPSRRPWTTPAEANVEARRRIVIETPFDE